MKKLLFLVFITSILFASEMEVNDLTKVFNSKEVAKKFIYDMKNLSRKKIKKNNRNLEYEMVIVTTSQFESTFQNYIQIKKEEGINTYLVTLNNIGDSFSAIRSFLKTEKENNSFLKYVMIVGDETIVPTYELPWFTTGSEPSRPFSSDYGYMNVLHFWPESFSNNDDLLNIEISEDLTVGRLPIRTIEEAEKYIEKYQAYNNSMGTASKKWSFVANNFNRTVGDETSSYLIEQMLPSVPESIEQNFVKEIDLFNEEPFDTTQANAIQGSAEKFLNHLNSQDHSFFFTIAHSNEGNYAVYDSECDSESETFYQDGHAMILTLDEEKANNGVHESWADYPASTFLYIPDLIPDEITKPYIYFPISCESANLLSDEFDLCSAQSFFMENGGPVLIYNSSCADNPTFTKSVLENGFDYLNNDDIFSFGEVIKLGWEAIPEVYFNYTNTREILFSHHIFGDPSLKFQTEEFKEIVVSRNSNTFIAKETNGLEIENVLITILENNDIIAQGYSPFEYETENENLVVTANKANFFQYKEDIANLEENAEIPYFTSFETGLDPFWKSTRSSINGKIEISSDYEPFEGEKHLVFHGYGRQSSEFKVNLEDENNVYLDFYWKDFADANDDLDGVYFSNDDGSSFIKIYSFDSEGTANNEWQHITLNLVELTQGFQFNSKSVIKFQHNGFVDLPNDGFAFDNISLIRPVAPLFYETNFEEDSLENFWTIEDSNGNGNIHISSENDPYTGNKHVVFDLLEDNIETVNKLNFHTDFSEFIGEDLRLKFYWKDFSDENNEEDGIYFSDNNGESFVKVYDFLPEEQTDDNWQLIDLSIFFLSLEYELDLNENFIIKIQQKDNQQIPNDGIAIDDFSVYEANNTASDNDLNNLAPILDNYPNPFNLKNNRNGEIKINYQVYQNLNNGKIGIYNLKGQNVKNFNISNEKGSVFWNGMNKNNDLVSSGIYFIALKNQKKLLKINKLLIIK